MRSKEPYKKEFNARFENVDDQAISFRLQCSSYDKEHLRTRDKGWILNLDKSYLTMLDKCIT
jgi:hypothetical protein